MNHIETIAERIRADFVARNDARDEALQRVLARGCWSDGWNGFWSGWFRHGFIDNPYWDAVTDWLNEDLLG